MTFTETVSILDDILKDCPAQYASAKGTPLEKWDDVKSKLSDLDTHKLHYVKVPKNHIVIDFDIPDEEGKKSLERNIEAASKWPATYAELSKSGSGIHLHYIYEGDASLLSRTFDEHIEIKVFIGKSSLRRKLTYCNDIPVATINSGLPMKGAKMVNFESVKNEKMLRSLIKKSLNREVHPNTKPSIDFIYHILEDAYNNPELTYDVSDMLTPVLAFANGSTNQANYCIKLVNKMHFKSKEVSENIVNEDQPLIFFDIEVYPNLLHISWKAAGEGKQLVHMVNPSPERVEEFMRNLLIGFNCRRYDNHLIYARTLGDSNKKIFDRSQRIINKDKNAFLSEAYNVSYTDVYDFCSEKKSLKKWEIDLGIHHKELDFPWDEPVPKELWGKVAEYCGNDVLATEAVFNARQADFTARKILAAITGMTVNDTTNSLSARFIFGKVKDPQRKFNYRDLSGGVKDDPLPLVEDNSFYTQFDEQGRPIFPGYSYKNGKSIYRGEEVGEGGYVYAEPGIYINVALLDIASMHPSSIIAEKLFGEIYTKRFEEIVQARLAIKHKDWNRAKELLDGKLALYIQQVIDGTLSAEDLAFALKIVINSVYGLTAANFDNPFRDIRNKDNIVAKRGALFNLKHEVQARGFIVAHIKTDSIKIPNATPEIIQFVMDYGKKYGYNFEHEATYDRMCLVNDAVYIAKYKDGKHAGEWTATGTQFQVPYVFKTLFTHEPIEFKDMCETKSVSTALYLDMNESLPEDEHNYMFVGKVGQFCPVKEGCGGGLLMRQTVNKETGEKGYAAASATKGYRWMESEMVKTLGKEDCIDRGYYDRLVNDAVDAISKYGDFEWFVSDDTKIEDDEGVPPWDIPDDPWNDSTLFDVR